MLKPKLLILLLAAIFSINAAMGQNKSLKGKIFGAADEGERPILIGATVQWIDTEIGAITNSEGIFEVERPDNARLLIANYVGYEADTISVSDTAAYIEITLENEYTTEEINVSARQVGTAISKSSIAKSETITGHGLRKAACCNLSESFETNASVDVSYSDAVTGAKQIELLGLKGTYTQLMTENIPGMNGLASAFGLQYIPGTWMESIQISKGAASVTSGYESTAGQINVEYKKPKTSEPLFVNLYGNEIGRIEGNINSSYNLNDDVGSTLYLHGSSFQNEVDYNGDHFLDQPKVNHFNAMNRWIIQGDNMHTNIAASALYEDRLGGQAGIGAGDDLYSVGIETQRYQLYGKNGYVFDDNLSSLAVMFSATRHSQDSYFGRNRYDAAQNSFYGKVLFLSGFGGGSDGDCDEHDHDHEHEHSQESKSGAGCADDNGKFAIEGTPHTYNAGFSYRYDEFDEMFTGDNYYRSESVPGAFLEYTYTGVENLTLVGGARIDYHNLYGSFFTPRFHARYQLGENTIFRASAGKGYRVANIFAENIGYLGSSRNFIINSKLQPEEAWNYGLSMSHEFFLWDKLFSLHMDYFRTDFINQVIVDLDRDAQSIYFSNLDGESFSNSFQVDLSFQPFERFDLTTAYRLNDVQAPYGGEVRQKPLMSRHKGFLNLAYATLFDEWLFDFTIEYNGGGRLPDTQSNPERFRLGSEYPAFVKLNAQVTKDFGAFSLYLGGENLTNYKQPQPILAYDEPFGEYFDSSMIWGPILGRKIYLGLRWEVY